MTSKTKIAAAIASYRNLTSKEWKKILELDLPPGIREIVAVMKGKGNAITAEEEIIAALPENCKTPSICDGPRSSLTLSYKVRNNLNLTCRKNDLPFRWVQISSRQKGEGRKFTIMIE